MPYHHLTRKKILNMDEALAEKIKVKSEQYTISQYRHIEIKTVLLLNFLSVYAALRQKGLSET